MSTDHITELKKLLKEVTDDELACLRAENKALRSALAKAEQSLAETTYLLTGPVKKAESSVTHRIVFDDANGTATVVSE